MTADDEAERDRLLQLIENYNRDDCHWPWRAAMAPSSVRSSSAKAGPVVLSVQDCDLVAKDDDLKVLRASRVHQPSASTTRATRYRNATHGLPGCSASCLVSAHDRIFGHPHASGQLHGRHWAGSHGRRQTSGSLACPSVCLLALDVVSAT